MSTQIATEIFVTGMANSAAIIDNVIAAVGDDKHVLKQCALVPSSFLLPSHKQLFSEILSRGFINYSSIIQSSKPLSPPLSLSIGFPRAGGVAHLSQHLHFPTRSVVKRVSQSFCGTFGTVIAPAVN
jgi:hypothetical protein